MTMIPSLQRPIDFGFPLPSEGEGSGVRGQAHRDLLRGVLETLNQSRVSGVNSTDGNPLTPQPLSRAGARGADNSTVSDEDLQDCHSIATLNRN